MPERFAVLLELNVATNVPALSRIPVFGETVKVTVAPDATGVDEIPMVDSVSPETRVIVPKVIAYVGIEVPVTVAEPLVYCERVVF